MKSSVLALVTATSMLAACGLPQDRPDAFVAGDNGASDGEMLDNGLTDVADGFEISDTWDVSSDYLIDTHDNDLEMNLPDEGSDSSDSGDDSTVDSDSTDIDTQLDSLDTCAHCPRGICDPETLECVECTEDRHCETGSFCDGDRCRNQLCSPGANFCVDSVLYSCSRNGGGFTILSDCNDYNPCTLGDRCEINRCVSGTAIDCSDGNPCTNDYCDVSGTCAHYDAEGTVCNDFNPCTRDDYCHAGACVPGGAKDCNDSNPCTFDYCVSTTGCVHEPGTGSCSDSNGCTEQDRCIEGSCSGDARDCDDHDECTADFCYSGTCYHQGIAGCSNCVLDQDCDDGDECTADTCDQSNGACLNTPLRTGGCCLTIGDCPPVAQCLIPICNSARRCTTGALLQESCCLPVVLDEDFRDGWPQDWFIDNIDWDIGWRLVQEVTGIDGLTGPMLYFGDEPQNGYDSGDQVAGTTRSAPVTLPASSAVQMTFSTWQDVDPTGGYDEFTVSILAETIDGPRRFIVWNRPSDFQMKQTTPVTIDLSGFAGHTVRIEFSFDSHDGYSNAGRGVFVDDIGLEATCLPLACLKDYHCKSAGINGFCRLNRCDFQTAWTHAGSFGGPGSGSGSFLAPTDLVSMPGPEGNGSQLLVSDSKTHYVQVFDSNGKFVRMFGGYGVNDGRFLSPRGMAESEGRVFIVDNSGGRVQAMTPAGVFLYKFGSAGIDPGQFDTPRDVGVSPDGNTVYVADTGNHRVSVFSRLGVYRYSFGRYGKTDGRFRTPAALSVAPDGRVWVCDTQNNRIQVFEPDGVLSRVIAPTGLFKLNYPGGIACLSDGRVVVADTYNHRLVLFNSDGEVVDTLGSFGYGEGQFNYPSDVTAIKGVSGERLAVADAGNFRIVFWAVKRW